MQLLWNLGYNIAERYGRANTPNLPVTLNRLIHIDRSHRPPVNTLDIVRVPIGGTRTFSVWDLQSNDHGPNQKMACLVSTTRNMNIERPNEDSIVITVSASNSEGKVAASQTWHSDSGQSGTQWLIVEVTDTLMMATEQCPPNQLCNGDFENMSRAGSAESEDCSGYSIAEYWQRDYASFDVYTRNPQKGLVREVWDIDNPGYFDFMFPRLYSNYGVLNCPESRHASVKQNNGYVGMLAFKTHHSDSIYGYEEGLSQDITIDKQAQVFVFEVWAYVPRRDPIFYARTAAIRLMISDTTVCAWKECNKMAGAYLDTIIVLSDHDAWLPIRTAPFMLIPGSYRVRLSATRCFNPEPDYGQGIDNYLFADDVALLSIGGVLEQHQIPLNPCPGDQVMLGIHYRFGAAVPVSVSARVISYSNGIKPLGSDVVAKPHNHSISTDLWIPFQLSSIVGAEHTIAIEVRRHIGGSIITDTLHYTIHPQAATLRTSVQGFTSHDGKATATIRIGRIDSAGTGRSGHTDVTSANMTIVWQCGAMRPATVTAKTLSGASIGIGTPSVALGSVRVPMSVLIPSSGSEEITLHMAAHDQDSLVLPQELTVYVQGIGPTCETSARAVISRSHSWWPATGRARIYPHPANEYVIVELPKEHYKGTLLTVYDLLGRAVRTLEWEPPIGTQPTALEVRIDVSELTSGLYLINASGNDSAYRQPFLISR